MLRFINLGSGSSGNATVVEASCGAQTNRLLIDCGLRLSELRKRLQQAGLDVQDIDAIFITHEHSDHLGHAVSVASHAAIDLWSSEGTRLAAFASNQQAQQVNWKTARDGQPFSIGALEIAPFTVPHDAREPLQLSCTDGNRQLGILTDLGHASSHVIKALQGCHALLLETNHDPKSLSQSAYPAFLKKRISGSLGHLSNDQSAQLLQQLLHPGLSQVIAAHLSERNNSPEMARQALVGVLGCAANDIPVAQPQNISGWFTA